MTNPRRARSVRIVAVLIVLAMVLPLFAVRCPDQTAESSVLIWHSFAAGSPEDASLRDSLGKIAVAASPRLSVTLVAQGDQLWSALAEAAGTGAFPDLLLAPAEWAPSLDLAGLTYVLSPAADEDWLPAVATALTRGGALIGLPAMTSTIALARRLDLNGLEWPATLTSLLGQARSAALAGQGALAWMTADLFYMLPWYLSSGGQVEPPPQDNGDPVWSGLPPIDDQKVLAWLEDAAALASAGEPTLPSDYPAAWGQGRLAFGPVTPSDLSAIRAAGTDVQLGTLPGGHSLLATWALMVLRQAGTTAPRAATLTLLTRLRADSDAGLLQLALAAGYLPARTGHFAAASAVAAGADRFLAAAETAVAMPAGSAAAEIWATFETALLERLAGAKANEVLVRLKDRIAELEGQ